VDRAGREFKNIWEVPYTLGIREDGVLEIWGL
jgi:hypothetical protein